jgi:hypothetical protein
MDQDDWVETFRKQPGVFAADQFSTNPRLVIFFNPINRDSMRLSRAGWNYVKKSLKLTHYEFRLPVAITPRVLLRLERHIKFPYFVQNLTTIVVLDETTAIMLQLHGNNLENYLDNLENHQ